MNYVDVAGKQKSKKKNNNNQEKKTTKQHNLLCNDFTLTLACTYACTSFTLVNTIHKDITLQCVYTPHTHCIHHRKDITLQCVHRVCMHIDYTA